MGGKTKFKRKCSLRSQGKDYSTKGKAAKKKGTKTADETVIGISRGGHFRLADLMGGKTGAEASIIGKRNGVSHP